MADRDNTIEVKTEPRQKISGATATFMGITAGMFDFLQGVLNFAIIGVVMSSLVSIVAWLTFFLWFKFHDVGFFEGGVRKLITMGVAFFIEIIPILNTFSTWTVAVLLLIAIVWSEDKRYNKKMRNITVTA